MQYLRFLGAAFVVLSSAWVGFASARRLRRAGRELDELRAALEQMESELRCAAPTYAALCQRLAERSTGAVSGFFSALATDAAAPDFEPVGATRRAVERSGLCLPPASFLSLEQLLDGFGRFDLAGQLRQLGLAREALTHQAGRLREQTEAKCRSYEILGLCAGAAVLILVV